MFHTFKPRTGGGGGLKSTPSMFRAIIWGFFPRATLLQLFSLKSFRINRAYRSEVTQRYVIERWLKIWEFSGFVYQFTNRWKMGSVLKIHFHSKSVLFALILVNNILLINT